MTRFSAPWGRLLKIVSTLSTALVCGVFWLAAPTSSINESLLFQLFLISIPFFLLGSAALFIILRYEISPENIEIVRVVGRVKYPLASIESVEFQPKVTEMSLRTFGNGGMYSISGFFRNTHLGSYRAYVTNSANCVVLRRKQAGPIVISPGEPIEFVEQVKLALEQR